jgi:colicin import membrane protein
VVAKRRGSVRPFVWSALLHVIVFAGAFGAWQFFRAPDPPETLAIEATVIDAKALRAAEKAAARPARKPDPAPQPSPEPVVESPPPEPPKVEPTTDDTAEREAKERKEKEAEQKQAEEARLAAEQRLLVEKAQREAEAKREAQARQEAEAKRLAEEKRLAEQKRAAEEARVRSQREAELRRSLEAEERADAMRSSGVANQWKAQIRARIERAWNRPPSARAGASCEVDVTQVPGGEVVSVRVNQCTGGDEAMRASVEAAVYRASPLPPPPDPALFERNLQLTFRPND